MSPIGFLIWSEQKEIKKKEYLHLEDVVWKIT